MYLMGLKKTVEENGYPSYVNFEINPREYTIAFEPAGLNHIGQNGEVRINYLNKKLETKESIPVIFEKDETNPYDKNAVKIYIETESGERIDCGFVPKYPIIGEDGEFFNQWFYRNLDKFKSPVLTYDWGYPCYMVVCELKDQHKEERDKIEAKEEAEALYNLYRMMKEEGLPADYEDYIDSGSSYSSTSQSGHAPTLFDDILEGIGCLLNFACYSIVISVAAGLLMAALQVLAIPIVIILFFMLISAFSSKK